LLLTEFGFSAQMLSAPGIVADNSIVFEVIPLVPVVTFIDTSVCMFIPWVLLMCISYKIRWFGPRFFMASGSGSAVVAGCIASFLMPKPLFIEDQTFFQVLIIFAERLAPLLFVSGLIGGWTYWFIAERRGPVELAALHHTNRQPLADGRDTCD